MADARQFKLEIERWLSEEVPARAVQMQKQIVAETFTAIVQATPVGNSTRWKGNQKRALKGLPPLPKGYVGGQARRNWQIAIGAPARSPLQGVDATGARALSDGFAVVGRITQPSAVWITNPLDYMDALENGWSKQAPAGMVAQAVAAISAKYARVS
jgi:hypothetical protein